MDYVIEREVENLDIGDGEDRIVRRHVKLPNADIPLAMERLSSLNPKQVVARFPMIIGQLTRENYLEKLEHLLWIEEVENGKKYRLNDMRNVSFTKVKRSVSRYFLEASGLPDGHPLMIQGDSVEVQQIDENSNADEYSYIFGGKVLKLLSNHIIIIDVPRLNRLFKEESRFDVKFIPSRGQAVCTHWAVRQAEMLIPDVLFPPDTIKIQKELLEVSNDSLDWFNKSLNERQKSAVVNILRSECRPAPYILFGPPGTGKTMTLVECVLQVFRRIPNSRIFVCGIANECADALLAKLIQTGEIKDVDMIRVVAVSRLRVVPNELKSFYGVAENVLEHRIIVSTCANVGQMVSLRDRWNGQITHTFIDEASQATEPESLFPIIEAAKNRGTVVLAGDPFQLGPVIKSSIAEKHGLDVTLLSRLFDMDAYRNDKEQFRDKFSGYDPKCITKLVESHRCCTELIAVNNELFYKNDLICHPPRNEILGAKFPIIFHSVDGIEVQENLDPSWYNMEEVAIVSYYLKKLKEARIRAEDIVVISPYTRQISEIKEAIGRSFGEGYLPDVVTVQKFQGGERKVVILSMVRSSKQINGQDSSSGYSFIFEKRRFNVATSRAKSLMIVVADHEVMEKDQSWKKLVDYCIENKAMKYHVPQARKYVQKKEVIEEDFESDKENGEVNI